MTRRATREIFVGPDEYRVSSDESDVLVALGIGSCIVGIVYDGFRRIGGMIHVMSPLARNGDFARMVQELEALGAMRAFMQARIVGGARMLTGTLDAGEKNRDMSRKSLEQERIPIVYEDTGDSFVRNVRFLVRDGTITISRKKISGIGEEEIRIHGRTKRRKQG